MRAAHKGAEEGAMYKLSNNSVIACSGNLSLGREKGRERGGRGVGTSLAAVRMGADLENRSLSPVSN